MFTDLAFDTLILILIIYLGKNANCGIPIFRWSMIYFGVLAFRSVANLIKIVVVRQLFTYSNLYSIISLVLIDGFFLGWLIYGNIMFYSPQNNCNGIESSQMMYNLMFVLLLIGNI